MTVKFDKDRWIKIALQKRYLIAQRDGSVLRAIRSNKDGTVDEGVEYRVVTQQTHKPTGRVYFNMTYLGFTKSVLVNRVIALRFLPNPDSLPQVNHMDGDKQNNALSNLEWSSGSDNEKHAHRTGLKSGRGSANSNASLQASQVLEIRASIDPVKVLAERYGVSPSTINSIVRRISWKHL